MSIPLVFILLFVLVLGIVAYRTRLAGTGYIRSGSRSWRQQHVRRDHRPAVERTDFRAVSIQCGPVCCKAARRLEGKRGFPKQIPRLPLSQCDAESCACTYVQHPDRRATTDRRDTLPDLTGIGDDRRSRRDRRDASVEEGLEAFNFADG